MHLKQPLAQRSSESTLCPQFGHRPHLSLPTCLRAQRRPVAYCVEKLLLDRKDVVLISILQMRWEDWLMTGGNTAGGAVALFYEFSLEIMSA